MIEPILPGWPAPQGVQALVTTRAGGVSTGPYDSLNLGTRCGDEPVRVAENRARLERLLPAPPRWVRQVHGTTVVRLEREQDAAANPEADAAFTRERSVVCTIQVADCLPVLFADAGGEVVGAAHAGWRGLVAGVLEATLDAMQVPDERMLAWFGPCIGATVYEVGDDVREAFLAAGPESAQHFRSNRPGHWLLDLCGVARQRLARRGVTRVSGGAHCTFLERERFFSYRRDGASGRMAALIWRS